MSRKGRRGRSRKAPPRSARTSAVALDVGPATLPSAVALDVGPATLPSAVALDVGRTTLPSAVAPATTAERSPEVAPPERVNEAPPEALRPVEPTAPSVAAASPAPAEAESDDEREPADLSVPPVGDLDARFFAESTSEAWLAHELELRHPQFLRKMTANVALRRARLARYVVGVVGVAVALCLAALVKSAVPAGDGASRARPAARMAMPPGEAVPLPPAATPAEPAAGVDGADGGG